MLPDTSVAIFVLPKSSLSICLCFPYSYLITEAEKLSHFPLSLQALLHEVHGLLRLFSPSTWYMSLLDAYSLVSFRPKLWMFFIWLMTNTRSLSHASKNKKTYLIPFSSCAIICTLKAVWTVLALIIFLLHFSGLSPTPRSLCACKNFVF